MSRARNMAFSPERNVFILDLNPRGESYGPRFFWANQEDTWQGQTNRDNTAARFAVHLQNDFKARLDWCIAASFRGANHPPIPWCQGDGSGRILHLSLAPGQSLELSAACSTDPDGDALNHRWYVYPEAGTYRGPVRIDHADSDQAQLHLPADCAGKTIHAILEATDRGSPPLTRYRRVVITGK